MNAKTELQEVWKRLESLTAGLWTDSSPRAVDAQALLEEFRAEMTRFDSLVTQSSETMATTMREHEQAVASLRAHYTAELDGLKKRIDLLGKTIHDKDAENERLLGVLAEHERRNADFHAQILKTAAESDQAVSHKMEKFYQELRAREAGLEESWVKRGQTLESEAMRTRELLAAKQAELDAWERRRLEEDSALKKRATDLEMKTQKLQEEYRLKQQEIETIKAGIQRSVSELVKQYQSRLKIDGAAPVTRER